MPGYAVVDNRTGQIVESAETYSEVSEVAKKDPANLYVTHVYRPGEVRL